MRRRWIDILYIEFYWWKRDIIRHFKLDTLTGISGILFVCSSVLFLIILGSAAAHIFRNFIPWVSGSRIGDVYWQSISFGIKAALTFMVFCGSLIAFIIFKIMKQS
ncbi:hypothetical protein Desaci_0124 [Desulfosporosinus acidiphilus SJ4]|uniref:Uncharacterized protein n=1 Tax=Desulfosporosinus acidiphilus (strain DSM 22704 / JCM 16185 / SJ4) TaxID=646529 RepID=I4D089_DESAJ|nr:hypothetical protein Desaci_0124 [Desulfosporosinus acidiphilus SJ4]